MTLNHEDSEGMSRNRIYCHRSFFILGSSLLYAFSALIGSVFPLG